MIEGGLGTVSPRTAVDGVVGAIGNTPLVALRRYLDDCGIRVWAKLEAANPGGSIKDRPALRMLTDALDSAIVTPGATIIESSSGNMGVGLAQACLYYGMHLICVVDERTHDTNVRTLRALGADVRVVSSPDPATGDLLAARLELVRELVAATPNSFWPNQYANPSNPAAHADGTMREIDEALGGDLDYLFAATSTTCSWRRAQPARCAAAATTCRRTIARRASSPSTRSAARCSEDNEPPAICPASAPASRRSSPGRPSSIASCASPTWIAFSAVAGWSSARRSSPAGPPERSAPRC